MWIFGGWSVGLLMAMIMAALMGCAGSANEVGGLSSLEDAETVSDSEALRWKARGDTALRVEGEHVRLGESHHPRDRRNWHVDEAFAYGFEVPDPSWNVKEEMRTHDKVILRLHVPDEPRAYIYMVASSGGGSRSHGGVAQACRHVPTDEEGL